MVARDKISAVSVGAPGRGWRSVPNPDCQASELIARRPGRSTSRARNRVYVNRNLRLDKIEMVGFDMDYTLALYNQARIEELSMRATLAQAGDGARVTPTAIQALAYDPMLAVRGLVVDRVNGNIFKPDRYGFPGRARHGLDDDRSRAASASCTSASGCGCRTSATPGSTRCSRCPRRCCTRAWSTTSIATTRAEQAGLRDAVGAHPRVHRPRAPRRIDQGDRQREAARLRRARRGAGRDAAQVPLVGEAALPADELGLGLHLRR